jgi:hypothetical protein
MRWISLIPTGFIENETWNQLKIYSTMFSRMMPEYQFSISILLLFNSIGIGYMLKYFDSTNRGLPVV